MISALVRRLAPEGAAAEDAAVRKRCGAASGGIGIALNLLLCAGKFAAGVLTGSISVSADAFNNLSDAGSCVVTLVGFRLAGQKPDREHPFGHGRIEYLAGLLVSLLILLVGVELGKSSVEKILHPAQVVFSPLSAAILLVSIAVKLWMYAFNRKLSRRLSSAALAATAADSLSDAAATAVVLLGLAIGHFTSAPLDGWLGALVVLFILRSGLKAAKDTLDPLLGQPADPALVKGVQETVLAHPEVVGLHDLVIHDYGPGRRMLSLHAEVPADSDILVAHDVIDHIERELHERFTVEAVIHMDPIVVGDAETDRLRALALQKAREIDPAITLHDFRMTPGPLLTNLIFDLSVPYRCQLTDVQIQQRMAQAMREEDPRYYTVIQVDRSYV